MRLWFRAADLAPHGLFAASAYGASPFATVAPSALGTLVHTALSVCAPPPPTTMSEQQRQQ